MIARPIVAGRLYLVRWANHMHYVIASNGAAAIEIVAGLGLPCES